MYKAVEEFLNSLSENDIEDYKQAFARYDKHRKGVIKSEQLVNVMRRLGENPTEDEMMEIITQVDSSFSGFIDFGDFMELMAIRMVNYKDEVLLKQAFEVFDADGSGFISRKELHCVMSDLVEGFTEKQMEDLMLKLDENNDGQIEADEFVNLIKEALFNDTI